MKSIQNAKLISEEHFKINGKCPLCLLRGTKNKYTFNRKNIKSNHHKKIKNAFSSNVQANRIKNFKNINFNAINPQRNNKKIKIKNLFLKKILLLILFFLCFHKSLRSFIIFICKRMEFD